MKTIVKKLVVFFSFIFMFIGGFTLISKNDVYADNDYISEVNLSLDKLDDEKIEYVRNEIKRKYSLTDAQVNQLKIEKWNSNISQNDSENVIPYYSTENLGTEWKWVDLGVADNQLPWGTSFENGGYIYWQPSDNMVSVSVSVAYDIVSMNLDLGRRADGVTGYALYCPPGVPTLLAVKCLCEFQSFRIYGAVDGTTWVDEIITHSRLMHYHFYNGF